MLVAQYILEVSSPDPQVYALSLVSYQLYRLTTISEKSNIPWITQVILNYAH